MTYASFDSITFSYVPRFPQLSERQYARICILDLNGTGKFHLLRKNLHIGRP